MSKITQPRLYNLGKRDIKANKSVQKGPIIKVHDFQATDAESGKSVFVKQAPEFVAIFGPDGLPLTSARMQQEQTCACSLTTQLENCH